VKFIHQKSLGKLDEMNCDQLSVIEMKRYSITETSEAASTASNHLGKSANENAIARMGTDEFALSEWTAAYPTASALLRELECPEFFRLAAKTTQWKSLCRNALNHWIALGRPEVSWRDAVEWECVQQFYKPHGMRLRDS